MKTLVYSLILWSVSTLVMAQEGPAMQHLQAFAGDLNSFQARFIQVIHSSDGQLVEEGSGRVWLLQPGYEGEFPEVIVADGEKVWLYDESLEQATVREQSGAIADSPLSILTRPDQLTEQFNVTDLGQDQGLFLLELVSRDNETEFERVILGLEEQGIRVMAMEDAFGMRTEIRFEEVLRNPDLASDLFTFIPPEGTDILGDIEP
jgi:outer membrane lipoprotein carrier protein